MQTSPAFSSEDNLNFAMALYSLLLHSFFVFGRKSRAALSNFTMSQEPIRSQTLYSSNRGCCAQSQHPENHQGMSPASEEVFCGGHPHQSLDLEDLLLWVVTASLVSVPA